LWNDGLHSNVIIETNRRKAMLHRTLLVTVASGALVAFGLQAQAAGGGTASPPHIIATPTPAPQPMPAPVDSKPGTAQPKPAPVDSKPTESSTQPSDTSNPNPTTTTTPSSTSGAAVDPPPPHN
jgi:hypothetical protein